MKKKTPNKGAGVKEIKKMDGRSQIKQTRSLPKKKGI